MSKSVFKNLKPLNKFILINYTFKKLYHINIIDIFYVVMDNLYKKYICIYIYIYIYMFFLKIYLKFYIYVYVKIHIHDI